jgi:hypothetical protein
MDAAGAEKIKDYWRRNNTGCGCEVPGMILLQASHPYAYSLLIGVTFEVPPLNSYELSSRMLPLFETFLELGLWKIFECLRHISLCVQYPEIFVPLRQTLFLETVRSHSGPNEKIWWVFYFSNQFLT